MQDRTKYMGGSDAGELFAGDPVALWEQKTGRAEPFAGNERTAVGIALEDSIAERYAETVGVEISTSEVEVRDPELEFFRGHVDRFVESDSLGIVDVKTVDANYHRFSEDWGDPESGEIPLRYQVQVQSYLHMSGRQYCDVATLIVDWSRIGRFLIEGLTIDRERLVADSDMIVYRLGADHEFTQEIRDRVKKFWECVELDLPPEPITLDQTRKLYRSTVKGSAVEATPDILAALRIRNRAKAAVKEWSDVADAQDFLIEKFLEDRESIVDAAGKPLLTRKAVKRKETVIPAGEYRTTSVTKDGRSLGMADFKI